MGLENLDIFLRLLAAAGFGLLVGSERTLAGKTAGMRTYALVSMGSALFVIIGYVISETYLGRVNFAPTRTLAGIITGVGFIGGGIIIMRDNLVRGLTSAAGLWVAAGVGAAAGFGMFQVSFFAALLTILIFTAIWFLEYGLKNWWHKNGYSKTDSKTKRGKKAETKK